MTQHVLRDTGAKPTTVKCPKCRDIIVYNGNFFCNSIDTIVYDEEAKNILLSRGACDWALPHPTMKPRDRNIVEELYCAGHLNEITYA